MLRTARDVMELVSAGQPYADVFYGTHCVSPKSVQKCGNH